MSTAGEDPRPTPASPLLGVAIAGIVLGPYTTTWLPFRRALEVQAVLVLGFTLIPIIGWFLARRSISRPAASAARAILGIVLYSSAAALGTLVALIRGNEPALIAGQALAMGLLPLGFVAAQTVTPDARRAVFVRTLVGSAVITSLIHFGYWAYRLRLGTPIERLYLPNAISTAGLVLMALLLAAAAAIDPKVHRRWLAAAATACLASYLIGTGTRSLWAAAALGIAVFFTVELLGGRKKKELAMTVVAVAAAALLLVGSMFLALRIPSATVFPQEAFGSPFWWAPRDGKAVVAGDGDTGELILSPRPGSQRARDVISDSAVLKGKRLLLASADGHGEGSGRARVDFEFVNRSGRARRIASLPFAAEGGWVNNEKLVHQVPDDVISVHVVVVREPADSTVWRFRGVRLRQYRTPLPAPIAHQLIVHSRRVFGTSTAPSVEGLLKDASVDFRVRETRRLAEVYRSATPRERAIGHGLGARFEFEGRGFDAAGQRVLITNPNYIHNFYAFLLFKLGVIGTMLVLGSIGIWVGWGAAQLVHLSGTDEIHWAAGYLAIWLAYLGWALFCPELIDFRVAPVVGLLIGSVGTFEGRKGSDAISSRS